MTSLYFSNTQLFTIQIANLQLFKATKTLSYTLKCKKMLTDHLYVYNKLDFLNYHLNYFFILLRWVEEAKLEAHSDWVRDVAWAPSLGKNRTIIASCSQDRRVIIWYISLSFVIFTQFYSKKHFSR